MLGKDSAGSVAGPILLVLAVIVGLGVWNTYLEPLFESAPVDRADIMPAPVRH